MKEDESISNEPDEEQGIKEELTDEEERLEIDKGDGDAEVYEKEGLDDLEDDDEVDPIEQAFMEGYNDTSGLSKCAHCGKPLDEDKTIEHKIKGKKHWFCSTDCVDEYKIELEGGVDSE